jgi:hypothetical protein
MSKCLSLESSRRVCERLHGVDGAAAFTAFTEYLASHGYAVSVTSRYLGGAAHFMYWLKNEQCCIADIDTRRWSVAFSADICPSVVARRATRVEATRCCFDRRSADCSKCCETGILLLRCHQVEADRRLNRSFPRRWRQAEPWRVLV